MARLRESVTQCIALIKNVECEFDGWLDIAMELSQAATESQGTLITKTSQGSG